MQLEAASARLIPDRNSVVGDPSGNASRGIKRRFQVRVEQCMRQKRQKQMLSTPLWILCTKETTMWYWGILSESLL